MPEISLKTPPIGSLWVHRNGNVYRVLLIANLPDEERYPKTVVYQNVHTGTVWARRADDWQRSFKPEALTTWAPRRRDNITGQDT